MTGAARALIDAMLAALGADPAVVAALGGPRVYDRLPRDLAPPFVALAETVAEDVGGVEAPAIRHRIALHVTTRAEPRAALDAAAEAVAAALDGATFGLADHVLVSLRLATTETRVLDDRTTARAVLRFEAFTEPA